jgi:FkbM family methyltransferase
MYYSQHKQDQYLDNYVFDSMEDGYFIDVGAFDGVNFSNTYFLEKNRSWRGICIEPLPKQFKKLQRNRVCELVNGVVSSKDVEHVEFCELGGYCEMLSGIIANYSDDHKARIFNEQRDQNEEHLRDKIKVRNFRFSQLPARKEIDLLSIDIEGGELDLLNDIDMGLYKINAILIEDDSNSRELRQMLENNDYNHIAYLGSDSLFVHNRHMNKLKEDRPDGVSHQGALFTVKSK